LTSCLTVCFANNNKYCQLSYSWFQTSQTRGQYYSDTSPFSIPCSEHQVSPYKHTRFSLQGYASCYCS
jgi:hypothetical protein